MATNRDFRDLFFELNAAEARYLVVGAYAVTYHSRPRYTKDLDVWVDPDPDNAARVWRALAALERSACGREAATACLAVGVDEVAPRP